METTPPRRAKMMELLKAGTYEEKELRGVRSLCDVAAWKRAKAQICGTDLKGECGKGQCHELHSKILSTVFDFNGDGPSTPSLAQTCADQPFGVTINIARACAQLLENEIYRNWQVVAKAIPKSLTTWTQNCAFAPTERLDQLTTITTRQFWWNMFCIRPPLEKIELIVSDILDKSNPIYQFIILTSSEKSAHGCGKICICLISQKKTK